VVLLLPVTFRTAGRGDSVARVAAAGPARGTRETSGESWRTPGRFAVWLVAPAVRARPECARG
jgi:hypothetical protein